MTILVTGAWRHTPEQIAEIEKMGHRVVLLQDESAVLPVGYDEIEGVICNGLFLYHPIELFTSLKYIQLSSAGFDRVPMDYVESHNIKIFNAGNTYSIPMAEYAVLGVLEIYKQSKFFFHNQNSKRWQKYRELLELYGRKVCIVGCGNVGTECAVRFKAFGCNVIGIDREAKRNELFDIFLQPSELDDILSDIDILVLCTPLTKETKHLINKTRIEELKSGCVIVNIARGLLIDESALIDCMDHLGGAVLDVFEEEPLNEDSPLWSMDKVIITPHNCFASVGNGRRLFDVILKNLYRVNE